MIIFKPIKQVDTKRIWYNYATILAFNMPINVVIGDRGCGKTYGAEKWVYCRFKYHGEKFVILRDTEEAVKEMTTGGGENMFSAISKDKKFVNDKFEVEGNKIYFNGHHAGYIMAVSTFYKRKGNDYADVVNVIYDEFIPETDQIRLGDDVRKFINSIQNITRHRKCRLILLANALDKGNGILELLGFENINEYGFYINKEKQAVLHYTKPNDNFVALKRQSLTGLLSSGTRYEANIINNNFDGNNDFLFTNKPKCDIIGVYVNSEGVAVRIYEDRDGIYYATKDINPNALLYMRYTFDLERVNTKIKLATKEHKQFLTDIYANHLLRFESKYIKNQFLAML